jgi:small nuclear ribonucleoprotein (snRNP)-like protein
MVVRRSAVSAILILAAVSFTSSLRAQGFVHRIAPAGGMTNLPTFIMDQQGNRWMIQRGGWLQNQNNNMPPTYSQAAMVMINQSQPNQMNNMAKVVEKTGEIIIEGMQGQNGVMVTRRIWVNKDEGYVRYIDIFTNNQPNDQTLNVQVQTNFNYGIQQAQVVTDKRSKQTIAVVTQDPSNKCAAEVFGGGGATINPTINYQQGGSFVQATFSLPIPAGKQTAIMHLHALPATQDAGVQFASNIRASKLMSDLPADVRKLIVNFGGGSAWIGDRELLRGDMLDVIELRTGDRMQGTIKEDAFNLTTFYGAIKLAPDRVLGMFNVGEFRPRQLLVTRDGEMFGGRLDKNSIAMQLSSGQVVNVPLAQISRLGYRKAAGEGDDSTFEPPANKPYVLLRGGDRICVKMPPNPIDVLTRYGLLKLKPEQIASIVFQADDQPVHSITLTDGSQFAGLVSADQFQFDLAGGATTQPVTFPVGDIERLQVVSQAAEKSDDNATVQLTNNDQLIGSLTGELKLDTAFDAVAVQASEIKSLQHLKDGGPDLQITLWDQSVLSGQLQESLVQCNLVSGVQVNIPIGLLEKYTQPQPKASKDVADRIKQLVNELNADDWKQRDAAEQQLVNMGSVVISTLKDLRDSQPPEAQQRIEAILKKLGKPETTVSPKPGVQ